MDNKEKFLNDEKAIFNFATDLYYKNKAMEDLVEVQEQKDLWSLNHKAAQEFNEINTALASYCQPQVKAILQVSSNAEDISPDFNMMKVQVDQLIQNYDNLKKLIQLQEKILAKKDKTLSKSWQDMKTQIDQMDIDKMKAIQKDLEK